MRKKGNSSNNQSMKGAANQGSILGNNNNYSQISQNNVGNLSHSIQVARDEKNIVVYNPKSLRMVIYDSEHIYDLNNDYSNKTIIHYKGMDYTLKSGIPDLVTKMTWFFTKPKKGELLTRAIDYDIGDTSMQTRLLRNLLINPNQAEKR